MNMDKKWEKFRYPLWLAVALLMAWYAFFGYKYQFSYNWGESMEPTLSHSEWIVVQKRSSLGKEWSPQKWDVVLIMDEKGESLCKRIVAISGDRVRIEDGFILINDKPLENPFAKTPLVSIYDGHDEWEYVVKEGEIWVIGDNIAESWYGPLPAKNIKGLVVVW